MNLKELEDRLRALIEIQLIAAVPGRQMESLLVQKLAAAMESNLTVGPDGAQMAPNVFTLIVNPAAADTWKQPQLLETLVEALTRLGNETGLKFAAPPSLTITTSDRIALEDVDLVASHRVDAMAETKGLPADPGGTPEENGTIPDSAFLIIEGVKVFPLKESVVNIGRRLDNHLVIDDPRISRNHAQLRSINGRYVVFDLNSTGGTFVNGQRTSQSVLYPGDVISLAGVALIFGQDNPPPRPDLADTSPLNSGGAERPTAVLRTTPPRKKTGQ
jgi:hypothetical protein